jgi:hypothetical protein
MTVLRGLALAGTLVLFCLSSAVARADTYCVAPASGCDGAHTFATVQAALTGVAGNGQADTIQLGATTYSENGLSYTGSDPVSIVGAGTGATTLRRVTAAASSPVFTGSGSGAVTLSHLRVHLLFLAASAVSGVALHGPGELDDVAIDGDPGSYNPDGVELLGSDTITGSSIALPAGGACIQVSSGASVTLTSDVISGCSIGLNSQGGSTLARYLRISDAQTGVDAGGGTSLTIEDSLLTFTNSAKALDASGSGSATTLTANHVTLVGPGSGTGAEAFNHATTNTTTLNLNDSIIRGFSTSLARDTTTSHPASIVDNYDDYDVSTISQTGPSGTGSITSSHVYNNIDPQFLNAAAGDYHLAAGSPLIDQDPKPLGIAESTLDFDGNLRIINGARDLGAFERPLVPTVTTGGASAIGTTSATLSGVVNPGGGATTWSLLYGPTAAHGSSTASASLAPSLSDQPAAVTLTGLSPGTTYHYAFSASNYAGPQTGADRTFTTATAAAAKPRLSGLKLSPSSFAAARSGASLAAASGARLRYRLSSAATVSFRVRRLLPGVRAGRRCMARKAGHERGRRCTRALLVKGSFSRKSTAGANSVRFSGRVGGRALSRGSYRLTATPAGPGGKGKAVSVNFKIVAGKARHR